jgi:hypothetical protein
LNTRQNGLIRKRSDLSSNGSQLASIGSNTSTGNKKQKISAPTFATSLLSKGGSLAIALQSNRRSNKSRTTFVQRGAGGSSSEVSTSSFQKCIAFHHVVFHSAHGKGSQLSKSSSGTGPSQSSSSHGVGKVRHGASKDAAKASFKSSDSLFAKLALGGYSIHGKKR